MWQPIETAPRDQPFLAVLNCAGDQTICTMRWPVAEAKNSRPDNDVFHVERVTHWMPLPDLPGAQPAPSVPDGVAEALQRLIENGAVLGPSSSEDALLVARYRQRLLACAPSVPEGWKLVPIEPTEKMINEGTCAATLPGPHYIDSACAKQCWTNMLAAAPEARP